MVLCRGLGDPYFAWVSDTVASTIARYEKFPQMTFYRSEKFLQTWNFCRGWNVYTPYHLLRASCSTWRLSTGIGLAVMGKIIMNEHRQIIPTCDICGEGSERFPVGGLLEAVSVTIPMETCIHCGPIDWEVMQFWRESTVGSHLN